MNSLPPEVLLKIIDVLAWAVVSLMTIGVGVFAFFHKGLVSGQKRIELKLDKIDDELQPIKTDIAVQREKNDSMHSRLNQHEERIRALENKHK